MRCIAIMHAGRFSHTVRGTTRSANSVVAIHSLFLPQCPRWLQMPANARSTPDQYILGSREALGRRRETRTEVDRLLVTANIEIEKQSILPEQIAHQHSCTHYSRTSPGWLAWIDLTTQRRKHFLFARDRADLCGRRDYVDSIFKSTAVNRSLYTRDARSITLLYSPLNRVAYLKACHSMYRRHLRPRKRSPL